jgi:NADPH2:quinone reductase
MAERTVVPRAFCFSVAAAIDDDTAAALPNPGVSAWLTLAHRAKLAPGETALILGATGVTGQLAVQIAKLLGAKRVIGAGRNERMLEKLRELGADATIQIDQTEESLKDAFAREAGDNGFDVIIDYLWGRPTEVLIAAITKSEFAVVTKETRLVQVGNIVAGCRVAQHGVDDTRNRRATVARDFGGCDGTGVRPGGARRTSHRDGARPALGC